MLPGQNRSGMGKKSFIQVPDSIYQKDPYKDQLSVELQYQNSMHRKSPMHEVDFIPASGFKTMLFLYKIEQVEVIPIRRKNNISKKK
jgi:hypothetical protein